ncbi:MAG: cytochrome c-type biogenesis protein CcmH [Nitrospiria bacterium]
MKRQLFPLIVFLATLPIISQAQTMDEDRLQEKLKEVSKTLRCAVCQSESVWESNATLAIQMRDIIRERLIAGETPDEIRAYFVSRYGDYIVFKPRFRGLNLLLWAGPFILLSLGGIILYRTLRKWTLRANTSIQDPLAPIDAKQRQRIEQELRSLK